MPLSAAVHDLPHCGRGQRGIDFFFKSSPVLASAVAQEKRDILAYFKRVEIAKDQEHQNYKSSLSSNTEDTDCSLFSSEEEEIKPGKNGKISSKENGDSFSENCDKNTSIKERIELANRPKMTNVDSVDLTDEAEHSGASVLSAKGQNLRLCNNNSKSPKNTKDSGKSDNNKDEKTSPIVIVDHISACKEGTIKGESSAHNCRSCESKSKECSEMESNAVTRGKGQVRNSSPPGDSTEIKKNAFAFMMANRARHTEVGKHSAEEDDDDDDGQKNDDNCVVVSNILSQNCETVAKCSVSINPAALKKKSLEVKSDKEQENGDTATDLNSSLQDFDLTSYEKPKRKRIKKPKTMKKDNTDNSTKEVSAPSDPPTENSVAGMPNYISFADYMKDTCSMAEEIGVEESIEKKADEEMENEESISKFKTGDPQQGQIPNSDLDCTKDDRKCLKDVLKENINSSLGCVKPVKKRRLSCSLAKLDEKQEVQIDHKDIEAMPESKQMTAKVKRRRTRKKLLMSSDSEEDFMMSKSAEVKKKEDSKSCDKPPVVSNTARISSFFKKINQKEKDEEEIKVVFTVQADVHAPLDGNKKCERKHSPAHTQACGELQDASSSITKKEAASNICIMKKNTKKIKKGIHNCNLDELNKIELLEQIPSSKSLSKKVLNKVYVEVKDSEVEKVSDHAKAEVCNTVRAKSKVTLTMRKGKFTRKGSVSTKKESLKDATGARKRLLRRKKSQSASSGDESPDELLFKKKKKSESPQSDKDITVISTSSSSSSAGCSGDSPEDAEEKSTSTLQSSTEASEDDKENVAHYTSQLVGRPGKLSLRIRRVHIPQETCRKEKLKHQKANKNKEHLKKARGSRSNLKKRKLRTTLKQKSPKEEANKDLTDSDGASLVKHNLITLDDDDVDDSTRKQIPKKATRRQKVTQTLLKPLIPKSTSKGRLQKKGLVPSKESTKMSESELQGGTQRRTPRRAAATAKKYIEEAATDDEEDKPKKTDKNVQKLASNKGMKLAPIFCKKQASSPCVELLKVVPLSPSKLKARQEFLNSSVSDDVRKQLAIEKSGEDEALAWPPFPDVSHVQQREEGAAPWNLKNPDIPLKEDPSYSLSSESITFTQGQKVLNRRNAPQDEPSYHVPHLELGDIVFSLSCMKSKYPDFPVYEVFKAYYELKKEAVEAYRKEIQNEQTVIHLDDGDDEGNSVKKRKRKLKNKLSTVGRGKRRKLGNGKEIVEETPQSQQEVQSVWHERTPHLWTQIFMPKNAKQVIGNAENVKKLKLWLQEWKSKPQIKPKKRKKKSSKKDDFLVSDDSSYLDEEEEFVSTYLLCGPPGAGKTAAVYALASELGYKVLEVNASSRRQGRHVMSQLAEATQSHSVSNASATSHSSSAFSALFTARTSSSMTKKESSQTDGTSTHGKDSSKMKGVSLVLFEDIDIVFEEWDEGFMSTVNSLMSTTKRPIILTATHTSPLILSQFKESFEIMEFVLPSQKLTAQHLQLVALANGCHTCLHDVECLVHFNKGDVRKSMLDLQLLSQSGSSHEICDCAMSENTLDEYAEDSWREIFSEEKSLIHKKPNQTEFYKVGLWRRLGERTNFNTFIPRSDSEYLFDKEGICWKEIESNINCILPFPVNEREKSLLRYPLRSDDPLLKRSSLWQYDSLISPDDGEEKTAEPVTELPEKVKSDDPPEVQKASQNCLKSLASMYDSLAQLDILSSSQITSHEAEIKDIGWWVKQPTAGLSDNPGLSHPYWTPHSNEGIIQELSHKAVTCCVGEVESALEGVSGKDWPQLCLPCDRRDETHTCVVQSSDCERDRMKKRSVISRIFDHLPAVNEVSRSAGLDYLPALRSLAREDELGAALGRGRRSRRFLSYFLQLGWSVSAEDRISLANSLVL